MSASWGYFDESMRPPPESGDGDEEDSSSWDWGEALYDHLAYMIDERNHTSARCSVITEDGKEEEMQVTFCLAPPPRVSYFCITYSGTDVHKEPKIVATEGNLALIVIRQKHRGSTYPGNYTYFVYHAPIHGRHGNSQPKLTRIPHPNSNLFLDWDERPYFPLGEVGILRYRTASSSSSSSLNNQPEPAFTPPTPTLTGLSPVPPLLARRHKRIIPNTTSDDYDAYKITTLFCHYGKYYLYMYDSKADAWSCKPAAFSEPEPRTMQHSNRVITMGGTMGWVHLWRGIILCDVHVPGEDEEESTRPKVLRYIELPEPLQLDNNLPLCAGTASFFRDIAVVQGRIKFVDLQIHASPFSLIPNGWTIVTWSMAVGDSGFRRDGELHSRDIVNGLEPSLFVAHPTLSSHDDDIIYLVTKVSMPERETRVISVDMKKKKLERVAKYTTQRGRSMDFAYMRTAISSYLNPDSNKSKLMKRRGSVLQTSSRKKLPVAITSMSKQPSGSGYGDDQAAQRAGDHDDNPCQPETAMDNDNMDLE